MRHRIFALFASSMLLISACAIPQSNPSPQPAELVELTAHPSKHVKPRNISIWLPPGYSATSPTPYPVIYAHDGQNLFEPGRSYGGVEWQLDETANRLMSDGTLRPAIIVGIWNTSDRWQEYAPPKSHRKPYRRHRLRMARPDPSRAESRRLSQVYHRGTQTLY